MTHMIFSLGYDFCFTIFTLDLCYLISFFSFQIHIHVYLSYLPFFTIWNVYILLKCYHSIYNPR